ncbi:KCNK1 [Mytilus coruscus]|uniref:KCNK1 n=1 Tax=Mytilus coruscus TaxID=42192 RepID=A0A6J8A7J8_MYTCO|nr:KCNK1 [Mytilus coruscus]
MSLSFRKSTVRLLALSGFYLLYIVIGASVFSAIEGPRERDLTVYVRDVREKFLKDHSRCLTDDDLEKFLIEINNAAHKGVSSTRNVTMAEPNWSFGQSIFFSVTVLTTIGYGRVTPLSDEGKGFIIVYTVIGLGDYIPGDNPEQKLRPLYKVITTCYLVIGLWAMMLLMSVLYDIPELNIGFHFYMKSDKDEDEERTALKSSIEKTGTKYTKHVDEEQPTGVQAETNERSTEQ